MTIERRTCAEDNCTVTFDVDVTHGNTKSRRYCTKVCRGRHFYRTGKRSEVEVVQPPPWPTVMLPPLGSWVMQAACKDKPNAWFDLPSEQITASNPREVKQRLESAAVVCADCPVRAACLTEARTNGWVGVWGGRLFGGRGSGRRGGVDLIERLDTSYFRTVPSAPLKEIA